MSDDLLRNQENIDPFPLLNKRLMMQEEFKVQRPWFAVSDLGSV